MSSSPHGDSNSILSSAQRAKMRKKGEESLYFFIKGILGQDWLVPRIHLDLCETLQDSSKRRVMAIFPRGWLKSTIASIGFPLWLGVHNPNLRILLVQNTYKNAAKKLGAIRSHFESNELLRALYPDVLPGKDNIWSSDALCLSRSANHAESTYEVAGTRTQVTSRHFDVIVEDDTVAPDLDELGENALSPSKDDIEKAIGWHRLVPPLLVNPKTSRNVIVGTRWFEKDLISWVSDNEPSFHVSSRACCENEEGKPDPNGAIVYPERFDEEVLQSLRDSMGPYLFSCLYMNTPVRSEDMIFHPEWFKYLTEEIRHVNMAIYTTVDPAGDPEDSKGDPDWNVVMTTGKDLLTGNIYVLDYFRKKCSPGELINAIMSHVRRFHPIKVGLETVAYQKSLGYWLRERMRAENLYFMIDGITHGKKSKANRIMGLQPILHAGALIVRPWMKDLVNEFLAFPLGKNDDLIDSLSMQLSFWQRTRIKQEDAKPIVDDPLSVECAMWELKERKRVEAKKSPIMDILSSESISPLVF